MAKFSFKPLLLVLEAQRTPENFLTIYVRSCVSKGSIIRDLRTLCPTIHEGFQTREAVIIANQLDPLPWVLLLAILNNKKAANIKAGNCHVIWWALVESLVFLISTSWIKTNTIKAKSQRLEIC